MRSAARSTSCPSSSSSTASMCGARACIASSRRTVVRPAGGGRDPVPRATGAGALAHRAGGRHARQVDSATFETREHYQGFILPTAFVARACHADTRLTRATQLSLPPQHSGDGNTRKNELVSIDALEDLHVTDLDNTRACMRASRAAQRRQRRRTRSKWRIRRARRCTWPPAQPTRTAGCRCCASSPRCVARSSDATRANLWQFKIEEHSTLSLEGVEVPR